MMIRSIFLVWDTLTAALVLAVILQGAILQRPTDVMKAALIQLANSPRADSDTKENAIAIAKGLELSPRLDLKVLPMAGLALSWASKDPEVCALLQSISPVSVCVR